MNLVLPTWSRDSVTLGFSRQHSHGVDSYGPSCVEAGENPIWFLQNGETISENCHFGGRNQWGIDILARHIPQ